MPNVKFAFFFGGGLEDASNSRQLKKSAILKNRFTRKIVDFTNLF
jgi:hypothetical protein